MLRYADRPVSLWRNGGGRTRELASGPEGSAVADFGWRVSVAEVAAGGEFSAFPGVDRVIVLCDGPAMTLHVDRAERALARHEPFAFSGDAATTCAVPGGPTRDLNVMTRRGQWQADVSVLAAATGVPIDVSAAGVTLVVALGPGVRVSSAELGLAVDLTSYDAVRIDRGPEAIAPVALDSAAPVAVIHLSPT